MTTELKDWTPPRSREMQKRIERARKEREVERRVGAIFKTFLRLRADAWAVGNGDINERFLLDACKIHNVSFSMYFYASQRISAEGVGKALNDYGIMWPPPDDLTL